MAEKIEAKEQRKMELKATQRALEQLKEIVNGSKEKLNEFIQTITNVGIDKDDYQVFLKNVSGIFYYHKCKNIYVIFVIGDKEVTLVEFLTETEFNEIKNRKS